MDSAINLHYANLPGLTGDEQARLLTKAYHTLRPLVDFLGNAKRALENEVKAVAWERSAPPPRPPPGPDDELVHAGAREGDDAPGAPQFWVKMLEELIGERRQEEVFDEFLRADALSDRFWDQKATIDVLDRDVELGLLCLSRLPEGDRLFIHPNTYSLARQIDALEMLWRFPAPEHRGLLRLIESADAPWPDFRSTEPSRWYLLKDPGVDGTLEQRAFVTQGLGTPDFAVLEGPPGSGKTVSICELILQEIERGGRVLLCASTHVAVDNVLEKLLRRGWLDTKAVAVRVGDETKVSEEVAHLCLSRRCETERVALMDRLSKVRRRSPSQDYLLGALKENGKAVIENLILEAANLVCGTTIGILQHPMIKRANARIKREAVNGSQSRSRPVFSVLILDEASKTTFPEFLVPARFATRWIIAGDIRQLSPYVETEEVEQALAGVLTDDEAEGALGAFDAEQAFDRSRTGAAVLCTESAMAASYAEQQAAHLGIDTVRLEASSLEGEGLPLLTGQLFLTDARGLQALGHLLPYGLKFTNRTKIPEGLLRRARYVEPNERNMRKRLLPPDRPALPASAWRHEVAWRLIRAFELRDAPEGAQVYRDQLEKLLPAWIDGGRYTDLVERVALVQGFALPSVLEMIQRGVVGSTLEGAVSDCVITRGLPHAALEPRLTSLTYQHRMHPEISRFPRETFYNHALLQDARSIERGWGYRRFHLRTVWIQVRGPRTADEDKNAAEAEVVMAELSEFIRWASDEGKAKEAPWEVAVLTFYGAQAAELRQRLRVFFGSQARHRFETPGGAVRVNLDTVDRFQGHEADLVLLSFVRNPGPSGAGVGFLDSPNRLNVAITRARYQLLLVGNRESFARQERAVALRRLADEVQPEVQFGNRSRRVG